MAHFGSQVEYGLHCLLMLAGSPQKSMPSTRDLAEFQGISPSYVAKLFTRLEKCGVVVAQEGIGGGFRLAKPASKITVLEVVDALEGQKPLFQCREIRGSCVLFEGDPPPWATRGLCGIHTLMLQAEQRMRDSLASVTLAQLAGKVARKLPTEHLVEAKNWFRLRGESRRRTPKEVGKRPLVRKKES